MLAASVPSSCNPTVANPVALEVLGVGGLGRQHLYCEEGVIGSQVHVPSTVPVAHRFKTNILSSKRCKILISTQ